MDLARLTRRSFFYTLGAAVGSSRLQARDEAIIATDFGAHPDGTDPAPGFAKAIAELARQGGGRLVVPRGIYTFAADSGVCIAFDGLSDITVEAEGAEFVFRGLARPLSFRNCHNVRIAGLTIRWARPPFSQGDVVDVAGDHLCAVIALDEITPADGWTRVEAIGEYERSSGLIARRGLDVYGAVTSVEPIDLRHVRLHLSRPLPLVPLTTFVLRHSIYEAHAIEMQVCSDMLIENVTIRSAPGMGFVAGLTRNITLRRCEIAPPLGSDLLMSTTADAVHFGNCLGDILIEGNRFAKMGDDGVNVTTSYWRIVQRPDARTMIVSQLRDQKFWPDDKPPLGDLFKVVSAATLESIGEAQVDETHLVGAGSAPTIELHFSNHVDGAPGDLIDDDMRSPRVVIRNNRFEDNRARGTLAHKNVLIENNLFQNQAAQAILLAPDVVWMEGPEITDVQITNNKFYGVDRWETKQGAITIDARVVGPDGKVRSSEGHPNKRISISANQYFNIEKPYILQNSSLL